MVVFYNMTESEVKSYTNFHLSIEVLKTTISLLLIDKSNSKPVAIEHLVLKDDKVKKTLSSSEIIDKTNPDTISCSIINSYFTLVPKSIFSEESIQSYLSTAVTIPDDFEVTKDTLSKREIVCCFAMDTKVKNTVLSVFPNAQFNHISSILCDSVSNGFHINFSTKQNFEVTVIKDNKLLFFNRFEFENKDESFYFLTLIAEKLNLNLAETKISLSGIVNKNGDMLSFWSQFLPKENLTFNEVETTQLNAISTHQYFTLHKQYPCVL